MALVVTHGESPPPLHAAAQAFLGAALTDGDCRPALAQLAAAAQARAAVLITGDGVIARSAITTEEFAPLLDLYMAGQVPPSSRQERVTPGLAGGFRCDHDDYTPAELAHDPFYQEFLRPKGFFWHANARLMHAEGDVKTYLSLKRAADAAPYSPAEIVGLDGLLPMLRLAAQIARRVAEARTSGMAALLGGSGEPVFEMASWGQVLHRHGGTSPEDNEPVLRDIRRRLCATQPQDQRALEQALTRASGPQATPSLIELHQPDGASRYAQVIPVTGAARDVFLGAAALVALLPPLRRGWQPPALFGLTAREAEIAAMVADGQPLADAATTLGIGVGTARNHLKRVFAKTGVRRQSELAALLARMPR